MKRAAIALSVAVLAVAVAIGTGAADAATKKKAAKTACVDRPYEFSWNFLWSGSAPQPNGCAPPVYVNGRYIGQDPDPNIRHQLMRDPATGYPMNY